MPANLANDNCGYQVLSSPPRRDTGGIECPGRGSGLVGLSERIEALGGSIQIESRPGHGTTITVDLPLEIAV
jgi:glucose-6-phosphate-specific signal transduction histidine kinase